MAVYENVEKGKIDWIILSIYLALVTIGWFMIYAVSYNPVTKPPLVSMEYNAGRQLIFIALSFFVLFFILVSNSKVWRTFSNGFYILGLVLLILVIFFGKVINGQRAWFSMGFFSFQPAEIAKFGTSLALADLLSNYKIKLSEPRSAMIAISMVMIPPVLIMFQPDAGSALVFFSFFIVMFREGLNPNLYVIALSFIGLFISSLYFGFQYTLFLILFMASTAFALQIKQRGWTILALIILFAAGIYGIHEGLVNYVLIGGGVITLGLIVFNYVIKKYQLVLFVLPLILLSSLLSWGSEFVFQNVLEKHQQERINVWLHPERCDPRGALYNVLQSKMAIGSGQLTGKGFMAGTMTKLNYVPAQVTDFIFCTIGEEHGFIGAFAVIGLYLFLILRLTLLAERQRLNFSRNYIWGVAGILFFHFIINIGMTMGLIPIIGIPLPFLSYGGSSLLGFTVLIGVALKLDSSRVRK
ncbi:MAG TPA: rod shape-determining protein RodA [Saprospiraceae bacterium]|nr:rod shape-determining protein RodA [Saprospiraceae bacterium]